MFDADRLTPSFPWSNNMKGAETESATQSAAGSKSGEGDVSIRTLEDLLRRYPIMRYHTRPWAAWP
jgi:hypothetical protein